MSSNNACVHTAGPWTVDDGEITASGFVLGLVYGTDDYPCSEDETREECQANARLIAAAPELLEAIGLLLCAVPCGQYFADADPHGIGPGVGKSVDMAKAKARAAVAKATGGQP